MKKRMGSLLLALVMCLSLLPASALAATGTVLTSTVSKQAVMSAEAVMSAKNSPLGFDTEAGFNGTFNELYFGTFYADMTSENPTGRPHRWRILNTKTSVETDGLFLLSMDGYGGVRFALPREVENGESWWLNPHNVWASPLCAARLWCGELAESDKVFNAAERGALLAVSKDNDRYYPTSFGYFTSLYGSVLNGKLDNEKVFYLSAEEFEDPRYGLTSNGGDFPLRSTADGAFYDSDAGMIYDGSIASGAGIVVKTLRTYTKVFTGTSYSPELTATEKFFLGSASDFGFFPSSGSGSTENYEYHYNGYVAHPAMNLDGGKLLYFMAADNSGHMPFGKVADASTNWQWKATLLNSSDTAFKGGVTLTGASDNLLFDADHRTVTVNHPALNTLTGGYNTVTAALLNAAGELVCYGSVSTNPNATSTVVTLPDNIPDGQYTLRISAEQWNGEQVTDLAAQPFETAITSAGAHSHPVCGISGCDEEHPFVAWTPVASAADLAKMEADGYYFLTNDVTAPETGVVGHLCANGNAVNGTLHVGAAGLSLCDCKGKRNVKTVAVAAGGTYDQHGMDVTSLSAGDGCTLNIYVGIIEEKFRDYETGDLVPKLIWAAGNATVAQDEDGNALLGEGTVLNLRTNGSIRRTGSGTPKLPKNCEIYVYRGSLSAADTTNEGAKVFLYNTQIGTIRLGRSDSLVIEKDTTPYIGSMSMAEGCTFTVPRGVTVAKLTEIAANATITVEDGGKIKQVTEALSGSTITVEDGGTLGQVDAAEEGSTINLHRCIGKIVENKKTYDTIVSSGDVNLYGAVSGATFKVAKPLNICAPLGAAEEPCTIDIMNADHTPKLEGGVFTSGWNTHMAAANPGDYFSTPTAYMIAKNSEGELLCKKRNHEAGDHPVCGASCTHSGAHTSVTWTEISDVGTSLSAGNYLLMTDMKRTSSGGTIEINGNVNICLNGYTLDLNKAHFKLSSGAELTICDCAGTGKLTNAMGSRGRLVDVPTGTAFRLYGGELSDNYSATTLEDGAKGGTVYVNGGTFTMGGGKIKEGIAVELVSGAFDLSGGTLASSWGEGAAVWQTSGTATMTGGTIDATYAPVNLSGGTFTLSNGEIRNSRSTPATVSGGTLQINGGSIVSEFYAVKQTGGIVNMTDGRVAGRYGVDITGGVFNMSGGTIDPSEIAESSWWGVRLKKDGTGTFNMSGGTITGYQEGGVELTDGAMTVSGTAKITGNTASNNRPHGYHPPQNLHLASGKKITVGTMSAGAQIGITMADKTGVFSSGGSGASAFFTADDTDYTVGAEGDNLRLNGTVQNATVTKILVNGEEAGKNSDNEYCLTLEVGKSVRLSAEVAPTDAAYTWYFGYSNAKITDGNLLTGVKEDSSYGKVSVYYKGKPIGWIQVKTVAPTSHTVTYNMQGHGAQIAPLTAAANATMMAPTVPTDTHYNFGGWYKDENCTEAWNFGTDKVTADMTLYAKWAAKSYTMTLDANGGTCEVTSVDLTYGQPCSALPTLTAPAGYTFDGWVDCDDVTLTASTVLDKTFPDTTAGRTLTAKLTPIPATAPTVTKGDDLTLTYGYANAGSIFVTATAASGHSLAYQWYICNASGEDAHDIQNATGSSLSIETGRSAGTYHYYCAVTATRGDNQQTATTNSGVITVTVNKAARSATVSMADYTYGGTVSTPGITGNSEDGTVTYYYSTENANSGGTGWEDMTATTLDAGTYYLYATIAATANYGAFTTPAVSFTVGKATPTVTWPTLDAIYVNDTLADGNLKNGVGDGTFSITGDKIWTTSGGKTTTVTFTPSNANYNTVTNDSIAVTVNKRTVEEITTTIPAAITNKNYGTALDDLGLPTEVEIRASGNKTFTVPVSWSGYDPYVLTEQTLTGTLTLTEIDDEVTQPTTAITATTTVTLQELTAGAVTFSDKTETYTGNPISHTIATLPAGVASAAYTYAGTGATEYESSTTAPADAGTYTVTVTFTMQPGYARKENASATLTINKAAGSVTAPTAMASLTYNGEAQTLIRAGSSTTGTVEYRLGSGAYGTDLPAAKNAGTYTVYYRVVGDRNHEDVAESSVRVTIAQQSVTVPAADTTQFTYTGEAQTYTVEENALYTVSGNEQTAAGTHTVSVALNDPANYVWSDGKNTAQTFDFVIAPATVTITVADKSAYRDSEAPDLSKAEADKDYTVSGLIGADTLTTLPTLSYDPEPDMGVEGDTTLIRASGADAGSNYTIEYVDGKLTITRRPVPASNGKHHITVDDTENGSVSVEPSGAKAGETVTVTVKPNAGYAVEDITITDRNGNKVKLTRKGDKYTFEMPETGVTVKVEFAKSGNPFVDVPADKYFYDAVLWAVENGITGGVDATHFDPYASCTRGQLVTFLWRAAGCPAAKDSKGFADVAAGRYCEAAVAWAAENGIVGGYDDGTFRPDATITRQQTAAILWRFAKYADMDVTVGEDTNILSFSDALTISDYAFPAIQWAVGAEVMGGSGGSLLPGNVCNRAQIVTMLYRSIAK